MMSIAGTPVTFAADARPVVRGSQRTCGAWSQQGRNRRAVHRTCPEWVYFWLGAARIGAVPAAVNAASKGDFLLHALRLSQTAVVVTDAQRNAGLAEVADRVDTLRSVLVQGDALADALNSASTNAPPGASAEPHDIALFFTSGTTGPSKAVATTWHYLFTAAATVASSWEVGSGDVLWTAMPLFHLSAVVLHRELRRRCTSPAPCRTSGALSGASDAWPASPSARRTATSILLAVARLSMYSESSRTPARSWR